MEAARQWAVGDTFGIVCRGRSIHMMVNGRELSLTCPNVPNSCYAVLDLYGPVTEVSRGLFFRIPCVIPELVPGTQDNGSLGC